LNKLGVPKEESWPYTPNEVGKPKDNAYDNAKQFKIKAYARITNLTALKYAIVDEKTMGAMIGVMVYRGMVGDKCKETGICPNPGCLEKFKALGGHALWAVGYDDDSPYFKNDGHVKVKNSWGDNFGQNGYMFLSYKYITNQMIDAFSSVDIITGEHYYIRKLAYMPPNERKTAWI